MVSELWRYARSSPEGLIRVSALVVTAAVVLLLIVMAVITLA